MFHLLRLKDAIEVEPAYFPKAASGSPAGDKYVATFSDLLWHRLSEKYVSKVIPGQGVCVSVVEVLEHSFGNIRGEDGAAWSTVVFTVMVACPVRGQRLSGTVASQDEGGIHLSLEVLTVRVPSHLLIEGSQFDPARRVWFMIADEENPSVKTYYSLGDECIVAIDSVRVRTQADVGQAERTAPIEVTGSFTASSGLGPKRWFEG